MKRAAALLVGCTIAIAWLVPAKNTHASHCAQDLYNHNGSVMEIFFCDEGLNIAYDVPRAGIRKHGVKQGTLLFEGSVSHSGLISGQARVFKRGCRAALYPVSGRQKGNRIVLNGQAPKRRSDCSIKGYRSDRLVFTLIKS